jgi:hypothetical protein
VVVVGLMLGLELVPVVLELVRHFVLHLVQRMQLLLEVVGLEIPIHPEQAQTAATQYLALLHPTVAVAVVRFK